MTNQFVWGALAMSTTTAALFFLRFFVTTRDRLFLIFAIAFGVLTLNWVGLAMINPASDIRSYLYAIRLLAFMLFVAGILDKNRQPPPADDD